jgi:hypothetical protein
MKNTIFTFLAFVALTAAAPVRAQESSLSTTLTVGYDSRYVLYGYRLSRHLYHADVYLYQPINDKTSVWGGSWYGYLTDGTYHEVDVYGGVDRMLTDTISVGLAYSLFNYIEVPFETDDRESEFAAHLSYTGEHLSLSLREQYDTGARGSLMRALAGWTQGVSDKVAIKAGAEAGYAFGYFIDGNLWNHAKLSLQAPYQWSDTVSISPFIARSIPLAAIDDFEQYETIYGINVSATF